MKDFEQRLHDLVRDQEVASRARAGNEAKRTQEVARRQAELEGEARKLEEIVRKRALPIIDKVNTILIKDGTSPEVGSKTGYHPDAGRLHNDREEGPSAWVTLQWNYHSHYTFGEDVGGFRNEILVHVNGNTDQPKFAVSARGNSTTIYLATPTDKELEEAVFQQVEFYYSP